MSSIPGGAALVLVLGSNVDAHGQLARARDALAGHGRIATLSPEVEAPSHAGDASVYANQALVLSTSASPGAFREIARDIETALGRRRDGRTTCALDIDIVAGLDADGALSWHDPAKLAPPLFVALACAALSPSAAAELRRALAVHGGD